MNPGDTAKDIGLEEGDALEVFQEQTGGEICGNFQEWGKFH